MFKLASVLAFLLIASTAHAQDAAFFATLQPGMAVADKPGCTWQWSQNTVGPWGAWYHACPNAAPDDTPGEVDPDCLYVNPYADKDKANECATRTSRQRQPRLTDFLVGHRYFDGYPSRQMMVIALTRGYDGIEVVTYQWTRANGSHASGDVGACRNTMASPSCGLWLPVVP
jgi:hypothetical protein